MSHKGMIGFGLFAIIITVAGITIWTLTDDNNYPTVQSPITKKPIEEEIKIIDDVVTIKEQKGSNHHVTIIDGIRATDPNQ